jgi:uncharacterized membrane protein YfcA
VDLLAWTGLAATTFTAALLQAAGGFGFAVVATPFYLIIVAPAAAVQLVIIMATALSVVVLPRLRHAVSPALLFRLLLGSGFGLPPGLAAFRFSDPQLVRIAAGATVLGFAVLLAGLRGRGRTVQLIAPSHGRDVAAGAAAGFASALVGMAGPPVLIYLLLAGAASQVIRATLLAFFGLVYAVALMAHAAGVGVPARTWLMAGAMLPFALLGGRIGRPLGDRLGAAAFTRLAIVLLAVAGLFTLVQSTGIYHVGR